MNRMEEYRALLNELDRTAPGLETTLDRAYRKKRKQTVTRMVRSLSGVAACFVIFVLLVNFCAPVAYACSKIPVLKELAEAVTFSPSLSDAVENEYIQPMNLTQTEGGITATIEYLIVDQKQVNIFYRLESEVYTQLSADPDVICEDPELGFSVVSKGWGEENGELLYMTVDFVDCNVPEKLSLKLRVQDYGTPIAEEIILETEVNHLLEDPGEPDYLVEFDFLLEFDPQFTQNGKVYHVNQPVELDSQQITITTVEVYPTHMRVEIEECPDNTAWIKDMDFYIETDWGMKFDTVANGISATGSMDSPSMISYRADSAYFYEAEHLKLVITGAEFLNKDMETMYLNLVTGETGQLPEGVEFQSAQREGDSWILRFTAAYYEDQPLYQCFGHLFYDAEGNSYDINRWSARYGDTDEDGNFINFTEEFPLRDYPYEEVWLSPRFSHFWKAEDLIVVTVQ